MQRGEIYVVQLGPSVGHETSGRRPVLVLSNSEYNAVFSPIIGFSARYFGLQAGEG